MSGGERMEKVTGKEFVVKCISDFLEDVKQDKVFVYEIAFEQQLELDKFSVMYERCIE
jgi:hypothetical protein